MPMLPILPAGMASHQYKMTLWYAFKLLRPVSYILLVTFLTYGQHQATDRRLPRPVHRHYHQSRRAATRISLIYMMYS